MRGIGLAATSLALTLLGASGCAQRDGTAPDADAPASARDPDHTARIDVPDAIARLRELASSGTVSPAPVELEAPRSIEFGALEPIREGDPAHEKSRMALEEVLELLRAQASDPPTDPPAPPAERARQEALRLYASGSLRLAAGDAEEALRDLGSAAKLDPGAPSVWARLADAQSAAGQRGASILSAQRAVALGYEDPGLLLTLGMHAARLGQSERAARTLARALATDVPSSDPLLPFVARVELSGALRALGYLRAANEALERGMRLPERLSAPTGLRAEVGDILRRGGDLWREAGDSAARMGDDARALAAYARSAEFPSLDRGGTLSRRVFVSVRVGRAAEGAVLLLDDIGASDGPVDGRLIELAGLLRGDAEVGPLFARALEGFDAPGSGGAGDSRRISLARARARSLPDGRAINALRAVLERFPGAGAIADDLFERLGDDGARVREGEAWCARDPAHAGEIAASLLRTAREPWTIGARTGEGIPSRLLRARLALATWRAAEGRTLLEGVTPDGAMGVAFSEARALCAVDARAWGDAERELVYLEGSLEASAAAARIRVLRAMQRFEEAADGATALARRDEQVETLLRASELELGRGRAEESERLLQRAVELDGSGEGAFEGLVTLYQAGGPLANAGKLEATARTLRERSPSGRLVRFLAAQELLQRGMLDEGERTLRGLLSEREGHEAGLRLLVQAWEQQSRMGESAALDRAEAWLRERALARPADAPLAAALGRVIALRGRHSEAITHLDEAWARLGSPEIARVREAVAREFGEGEGRADEMTLERTARASGGVDGGLERIGVLARTRRYGEAAGAIEGLLAPRAALTGAQHARLLQALQQSLAEGLDGEGTSDRAGLLAMLGATAGLGVAMPWEMERARWHLLIEDPASSDDRIVATTRRLLASLGSVEEARRVAAMYRRNEPPATPTLERARAEVAYVLGAGLYGLGRNAASEAVFREALTLNPGHAMAANDLGYHLAEERRSLDEAERLLMMAASAEPANSSVTDSLGWLRYITGVLEDRTEASGTVVEGAVTLLRRATTLGEGGKSPTILDHLGDALWVSGDRAGAVEAWRSAERWLIDQLVRLEDGGESEERARITAEHSRVATKADAAERGGEPEVAPMAGGTPAPRGE